MEEWKDIPGYEGRYQISSARRFRSIRGNGNHKIKAISSYCGQDVIYLSTGKKSRRVNVDYLMSLIFGERGNGSKDQQLSSADKIAGNVFDALLEIGPVLNLDCVKDRAAALYQITNAVEEIRRGNQI